MSTIKPTIDQNRPFIPVRFAVLTVSDSRSLDEDRSGALLASFVEAAGHHLAAREIVTDDIELIRTIVKRWSNDASIDAIITTGGTGLTGRDVTPEAIEPLFDKRIDGFSQVFHRISYDKIGTTFIFVLPGSPGACRDAWDHILQPQFNYRHMPCNFVEIMPRLDEHLKREGSKAL